MRGFFIFIKATDFLYLIKPCSLQPTIIQQKIYDIMGAKVMLDVDLASLFDTETKYLKRAVRQIAKGFPPDFIFELTKKEWKSLRYNFSKLKDLNKVIKKPPLKSRAT